MSENKITILLATHNRAHLIGETLNTILAQTHKNWECIIIDDFSTDNSYEVIDKYLKKDRRFEFHRKHKGIGQGLSASRNFGLELLQQRKVEFLQFFDDDDLMHPRKLELQLRSLSERPEAMLSICGSRNFDEPSRIHWDETQEEINRNFPSLGEAYLVGDIKFVAQVPLFRWEFVKNVKFDESLFYAEEWVLFSKQFLLTDPQFIIIPKVLYYRRKHPESITESKDLDFRIRKTVAVTHPKIFEYLTENHLHTRRTLFYFARHFLLYQYNSAYLYQIKTILKARKDKKGVEILRFSISKAIHGIARKFILLFLKN